MRPSGGETRSRHTALRPLHAGTRALQVLRRLPSDELLSQVSLKAGCSVLEDAAGVLYSCWPDWNPQPQAPSRGSVRAIVLKPFVADVIITRTIGIGAMTRAYAYL